MKLFIGEPGRSYNGLAENYDFKVVDECQTATYFSSIEEGYRFSATRCKLKEQNSSPSAVSSGQSNCIYAGEVYNRLQKTVDSQSADECIKRLHTSEAWRVKLMMVFCAFVNLKTKPRVFDPRKFIRTFKPYFSCSRS